MSEASFQEFVETVARAIDAAGVGIIVIGLVLATGAFLAAALRPAQRPAAYHHYRQHVGKAVLLGLEFLVAADIIRTVAVEPTFRGVGVLGLIVLVRTFLSFALTLELEGRWPWQKGVPRDAASG
jgi:uncharacterized membrane protein